MGARYNAAEWLVDRQVEAEGSERTAFICETTSVTYGDLQCQVWRAQHALKALDARRDERVLLLLSDEFAFPAWFLGGLRSGIVPVPVSTMLTGDELGAIAEDAGAGLAVVSSAYAGHLGAIAAGASDLRGAVVVGEAEKKSFAGPPLYSWEAFDDLSEAPVAGTGRDTPGFWLYSSGTTGTPKGVMHRHTNLEATALTYASSVLDIGPEDRCLSVAKLFFAYGLGNSLTFPLSVGASSVLNPARPTPAGIAQLLVDHRATLFFATPGFLAALLDSGVEDKVFGSVRLVVTAGETLPAEIQRLFEERFGVPVLDGIGSTEALHIFLSNHQGRSRPGTTGTPVAGYDVKLLDDEDKEVIDADTPGYLHVRGPSIATGYWCRTEATQSAFRADWLRTGDVYTRSADGYFTFLGRNNDMIKAGGIWVSPAEVEGVLVEHPDVLEAAVVGSRDARGLETTVAFVVPRSGHGIEQASIDAHCRKRMAAFKRPRRVIVLDALPKTATGKVQRFALRNRLRPPG
jgi:benzoate-CoA ligase family protein